MESDIAFGALDALLIAVDRNFVARLVVEVAREEIDVDVLCVDSVVLLCVTLAESLVRRKASLEAMRK